ncbi:hypothetical protein KAJ27_07410 [bacterium]|nr:hypothetical protein [bacterium]
MNEKQKIVISIAIILIILTFLWVPYKFNKAGGLIEYRYGLIFSPPNLRDYKKVFMGHYLEPALLQMLAITLVTIGLVFVFKDEKKVIKKQELLNE